MFPITSLLGKIVYALLVAVVTFIVVFILAVVLKSFSPEAGTKLQEFAPLIGLLAGLVSFFLSPRNVV